MSFFRERPEDIENGADEWAAYWLKEAEKVIQLQHNHIDWVEGELNSVLDGWDKSNRLWFWRCIYIILFFVFYIGVLLILKAV